MRNWSPARSMAISMQAVTRLDGSGRSFVMILYRRKEPVLMWFDQLPDRSRFAFHSSLGDLHPRSLTTIVWARSFLSFRAFCIANISAPYPKVMITKEINAPKKGIIVKSCKTTETAKVRKHIFQKPQALLPRCFSRWVNVSEITKIPKSILNM